MGVSWEVQGLCELHRETDFLMTPPCLTVPLASLDAASYLHTTHSNHKVQCEKSADR